jgi:hypothetical protein
MKVLVKIAFGPKIVGAPLRELRSIIEAHDCRFLSDILYKAASRTYTFFHKWLPCYLHPTYGYLVPAPFFTYGYLASCTLPHIWLPSFLYPPSQTAT